MFLSRIDLQITSPSVRQALKDCQDMHRTLLQALESPRAEEKMLYREFRNDQSIYLYVQSEAMPRWEKIDKLGYHCIRVQDISAITEKFRTGNLLRFSVLACPTKKVKTDGKNSKRILIRNKTERQEWLQRQGAKNGFSIIESYESEKEHIRTVTKSSGAFTLSGVPFEGVLQITDKEQFQNGFANGIGAEKAYGFGMLMLRKL